MAAAAKMKRFEIKRVGTDYSLHIETESGDSLEMMCTHDQLDVLADKLDDILLTDEALDEVKD